eukprot:g6459.t1
MFEARKDGHPVPGTETADSSKPGSAPSALADGWMDTLAFEVVQPDGSTLEMRGGQLQQQSTSPSHSKMTRTADSTAGNTLASEHELSPSKSKYDLSLYILMEFCSQRTLREHLDNRRDQTDPKRVWRLDIGEVVQFMIQIASALEYIHSQKLIHRDLKPSNIFKGDDDNLKLGDFGLARTTGADPCLASTQTQRDARHSIALLSNNTQGVGTALYMSPEQMLGREYDAKTDLYSLGVILFELLHPPFATSMERYKTMAALHPQVQQDSRDGTSTDNPRFPAPLTDQVGPEGKDLLDLMKALLSENASNRPSAADVLKRCKAMLRESRGAVEVEGCFDWMLHVETAPFLQIVALMSLLDSHVSSNLPGSKIAQFKIRDEAGGTRVAELGLELARDGSTLVEAAKLAHARDKLVQDVQAIEGVLRVSVSVSNGGELHTLSEGDKELKEPVAVAVTDSVATMPRCTNMTADDGHDDMTTDDMTRARPLD